MALKDPKARRAAIHYEGGKVMAAYGLLEYLFGADDLTTGPVFKTNPTTGRRTLVNTLRRDTAIGGKQVIVFTKGDQDYQLHYSGSLVDFVLHAVPKMKKEVVLGWSTARGTKKYLF